LVPLKHRTFLYALDINKYEESSIIIIDRHPDSILPTYGFYYEISPPFKFDKDKFLILSNDTLIISIIEEKSLILKTKNMSPILKKVKENDLETPYYQISHANDETIELLFLSI